MQNKKVFIFIVEHEYLEPKVKSTKKSDEFREHKDTKYFWWIFGDFCFFVLAFFVIINKVLPLDKNK